MSKINLNIDNKFVAEIENKVNEINKYVVLVSREYINELEKANIPFKYFTNTDEFYIVRRGKKPKKFNDKQAEYIKQDLGNGLSIRKAADKYKCSTKTIQSIKNDTY